jgi:hypothetical protein
LPSRFFHNPPPQSPSLRLVPRLEGVKATKMPTHLVPFSNGFSKPGGILFLSNSSFCCAHALPCVNRRPFRTYPLPTTVIARSEATWRSQIYFYATSSKIICTSTQKIGESFAAILCTTMKLQVNN